LPILGEIAEGVTRLHYRGCPGNLSGKDIVLGQHSGEFLLVTTCRIPMGQAELSQAGHSRMSGWGRIGKLSGGRTEAGSGMFNADPVFRLTSSLFITGGKIWLTKPIPTPGTAGLTNGCAWKAK
jgi:hypothetical protein